MAGDTDSGACDVGLVMKKLRKDKQSDHCDVSVCSVQSHTLVSLLFQWHVNCGQPISVSGT